MTCKLNSWATLPVPTETMVRAIKAATETEVDVANKLAAAVVPRQETICATLTIREATSRTGIAPKTTRTKDLLYLRLLK